MHVSIVVRGGIGEGGLLLFSGVFFENPIILSQHGEYIDACSHKLPNS